MARLVVFQRDDGGAPGRYEIGDVVEVFEDGHPLGRMVSLDSWEKAGGDPKKFPAIFRVVDLEGLSVAEARALLETVDGRDAKDSPVLVRRRAWKVDAVAMERRQPGIDERTGKERETIFNRHAIKRRYEEVAHLIARKS